MKKSILLLVFIINFSLFTIRSFAQAPSQIEVPTIVKDKLINLYPNAKDIKWEKEDKNYEANFMSSRTKMSVEIDEKGNVISTETEIRSVQLPKPAQDYILKNFGWKKIERTIKEVDAKNVISFEVKIDKKELIFDEKGNFLKKEK